MSKIKLLLAIFASSFIGIMSNPEVLTASDSVAVNGLDNTNIVETVPAPEPEPEPEVVAYTPSYSYAYVYEEPVCQLPTNYIQINGVTVPLGYTTNDNEDAGGSQFAWYYGTGTYIYGHNLSYVFGSLDSAFDGGYLDGMTFTVVMNGVANNYVVVYHRLFDFISRTELRYNGVSYNSVGVKNAYLDGVYYDMAIKTCYNGSAQNLVAYARKI